MPLPIFALELARDRLSKRWFTQAVTQARIFDPTGALDAGYLDLLADARQRCSPPPSSTPRASPPSPPRPSS